MKTNITQIDALKRGAVWVAIWIGMAIMVWSCAETSSTHKSAAVPATLTKDGTVEPVSAEFKGTVAKVDADKGLVTVQRLPLSKTFKVAANCQISTPTNATASLAELKVNDPVTVAYATVGEELVASRIAHGGTAMKREQDEKLERLDEMLNPSPNQ
jgi:hypothetical protein